MPLETQTEAPARAPVTVVTQENYQEYVNTKLAQEAVQKGQAPAGNDGPEGGNGTDSIPAQTSPSVASAESSAKDAAESAAGPKEFDKRVTATNNKEVFYKGKWVDEGNFSYRLHLKTEEALKPEREAKAAAEKAAKDAADRAAQIEAERDALKAKYEPVKTQGPGHPPQRAQFASDEDWQKSYSMWADENASFQHGLKTQHEARVKAWEANKSKVREEFPNWDKTVGESSVVVNDGLREAIYDSEHGPRLLLHLAEHPDVAKSLNSMAPGRMQREIGRLEASFANKAVAPAAAPANPVAEISRAPAPISPIRGEGTEPVTNLKGSDKVPQNWTFEDYKKARRDGRIR